ncbi:hypothetical protein Bca52824_035723 [Brassica carinata]|uniref:Uncharacterized protein n=1 Tax=Brassica carinata TaxID=52824 RepID=A0A8X7V314_BRACI|nr:hypothetical protein Bca52824_035723 [Brassica carinata]
MWRPNYTTASLWLSAEMVADGGVMLKSSAASLFLLLCSVLPPRYNPMLPRKLYRRKRKSRCL